MALPTLRTPRRKMLPRSYPAPAPSAPVLDGAGGVPGAKHGVDGQLHLLVGVGGQALARLLVHTLEAAHHLLQVLASQLHIQLAPALRLKRVGRGPGRERAEGRGRKAGGEDGREGESATGGEGGSR